MIRKAIYKHLRPIVIWVSHIHSPWSRKALGAEDWRSVMSRVCIGDILLSRTNGELGNLFIKGTWKHAAIYAGNAEVIEATSAGVKRSTLVEFVLKKDAVAIMRPLINEAAKNLAVKTAESFIGLPYDYDFESANKAIYCVELVVMALDKATQGQYKAHGENEFGGEVFFPDMLANDRVFVEPIIRCSGCAG